MSSSLTGIENQLYEHNSRLSTIETCLCNMFNSVSTPDSSFNESSTVFPTEPPTHANISLLAEEDASFPTVTHNKHHLSTQNKPPPPPLFPLWCLVCGKRKPEKFLKKEARDRGQYVRGSMDVLFTPEEMAVSNLDGKRNKRKLDGTRVDLLQCKLNLFTFFNFSLQRIPKISKVLRTKGKMQGQALIRIDIKE